ncbi:MAG: hypothetical protein ACLGQX_08565 [Acidobacteriota bacterium]
MKTKLSLPLTAAVLGLLGTPLLAQMTGVSHPDEMDDTQPTLTQDGSHYVPPGQAAASTNAATPAQAAPALYQRVPQYRQAPNPGSAQSSSTSAAADPDGEIVTSVPVGPNELPIGTPLNATLQEPISTQTTQSGSRFTARLKADVSYNGVVLLPAGSIVYGQVSHIHSGSAGIRLQPNSVSLPDGTVYPLRAEVTDLDHYAASHVDAEGTIVNNTHPGQTAAVVGLATTSTMVAGAMIAGGVGALVGLGVGAGAVTIWWLKHDRRQELPSGTPIVFTLDTPLHFYPSAAQVSPSAR